MDPGLWELYEAGSGQDEVSVIIRLKEAGHVPHDVHIVSRFGKVVTARILREDIRRIHASEDVASMKASWSLSDGAGQYEDITDDGQGLGSSPPFGETSRLPIPEDGSGIVLGVCDWGFDFTHENFRNLDGTTRLLALWDQSAYSDERPMPYGYGRVYSKEEINSALATPDPTAALGYFPSKSDPRGNGAHGTHVCDIAAGNRRVPGSEVGLASGADIVFVHLARQRLRELENFGDSVRLLEGLDFVRRQAGDRPLVAHFSAGMTGGPHDGTALFEQAVDALVLERPGIALVQSCGNYAASRMHTHGRIGPDQKKVLHWMISSRDRTPNELEVWYSGKDHFDLALIAPNGERFKAALGEKIKLGFDGERRGAMYHRKAEPNSGKNHINIFLKSASPSGRYRIELRGRDVVDGRFQAWIERDSGGRNQSHFPRRQATPQYTTNTICNSFRGIAVGAVDATAVDRPVTRFSSRGPTADGRQKPELVAPGHRIRAARSLPEDGWQGEQRLTAKSGTSMAAPFVSGTVMLMMQAAGRPLSIAEVRRILIGTADPPPGLNRRSSKSLGYGYLNTVAAVDAARRIGQQGSFEAHPAITYEEQGDDAAPWSSRWVVDQQPFDHGTMGASTMVSEAACCSAAPTDEGSNPSDDGLDNANEADSILTATDASSIANTHIAATDEVFDTSAMDDVNPGKTAIGSADQAAFDLSPVSEASKAIEADEDEGAADEGPHRIGINIWPGDGMDLKTGDGENDTSMRDLLSPQEEEEEEAHRLTALYDAIMELTEKDQV